MDLITGTIYFVVFTKITLKVTEEEQERCFRFGDTFRTKYLMDQTPSGIACVPSTLTRVGGKDVERHIDYVWSM